MRNKIVTHISFSPSLKLLQAYVLSNADHKQTGKEDTGHLRICAKSEYVKLKKQI